MKKLLTGLLLGGIFLTGCSVEVSEGENEGTINVGLKSPEEVPKRTASEIKAEGSLITLDEMDILENDTKAYQNRPFEDVPVHITGVDRYSDYSIIYAEYLENPNEDERNTVFFALLMDGNDTALKEGDHGYISGVVAEDIKTDAFILLAVKGAFKDFTPIDELSFHNPNLVEHVINQTKSNDYVSVTLEKIVTGDNFTVVYYSFEGVEKELSYAYANILHNGNENQGLGYSSVGLENELEGDVRIFTDVNTSEPFEVLIDSPPDFMDRKNYVEKNTEPLIFEINGLN